MQSWVIGSYRQLDTKCPDATEPSFKNHRTGAHIWPAETGWRFASSESFLCTNLVSMFYDASENGGNRIFWEIINGKYHLWVDGEWLDVTVELRLVPIGTC